jgi:putative PEP-CTERM system histidine kinase
MSEFGAIGYALTGGLYALLTVLLLMSWRGQRIGGYLIAACLMSAVWSGIFAVQTARGTFHPLILFVAELLRSGVWIVFLARLLSEIGVGRMIRYSAQAVWIGFLTVGIVVWLLSAKFGDVGRMDAVLIPGGLALALTGLVLIEQLYRNSPLDLRWSLKLLVLGLGGMFAYDLFLYSQAVLFKAIDSTTFIARGPVNLFFVPLIAVAARRNPTWDLKIFVSRQVVFYSTTLVAVGLYFLLMSAGGYLIVRYSGSWGGVARVVFFVGAGVVLATLLFSSMLRARAKVFLSKHFFHNKYDYRDEWLRLVATLAKFEDSSARQVVIEAMAQVVDSPSGLLWVLDEQGNSYRLAASYKLDEQTPDIGIDDDVVAFIKREGWLIDLAEYSREPQRYKELQLPAWLSSMGLAWLLVPLMSGQKLLGLVLLNKAPGPPRLNYEDRDLLKTVGSHIAVHLAQEKSDNLLAEAQQFEAYNRLTAFLMHDLNNLIAQQSLIVSNAEKHKRNPDFVDDAIQTIANSVNRMKGVMAQLKRGEAASSAKKTAVKLIVSAAVDRCAGKEPVPNLRIEAEDVELSANVEEFTMVLVHLIRNAQDAMPADGDIDVALEVDGANVLISIVDTGSGMSAHFIRDRLFRPFDSTKGVQGMGIGAYQAREFARKLGGELKVESEVGKGTMVTMILPLP